ncbi:hypothetical protein [Saccharomonospora viridis]|jgi:hypothetical protein|uniref:hypothetical protein n=1 Tax=Saccharomonospora viridis TaxID=1852 RepID=UPI0008ED7E7E|nr:hypothetical protein [Saccharomonospora viridis]SFP71440.1 hypothetical protein SAMN02982918_3100 [Saccharomonospora viridis]
MTIAHVDARALATAHSTTLPPWTTESNTKERTAMLIHEELARARIRDMLRSACQQRRARHARSAHRWARVAAWAQRRADRFES